MSFAWVAGDHEQALSEALKNLPHDLHARLQLVLPVQTVVCRLGTLEREVWSASGNVDITAAMPVKKR